MSRSHETPSRPQVDEPRCICGNTALADGFHSVRADGTPAPLGSTSTPEALSACMSCGCVLDRALLERGLLSVIALIELGPLRAQIRALEEVVSC